MPELRLVIDLELDGEPLQVSPIVRTISVNQEFLATFTQSADNNTTSYHQVENAINPILQALLFTADQPFNMKFDTGVLAMSANGLVLMVGMNMTAGAATNAQVNVPGATAANVTSLAGGT